MIITSGIQPSGTIHLGNYFGAIKQQIELQNQGQAYYFIADYHALTSLNDGSTLRENSFNIACTYLALGLDPAKAILFKQSDVPEVTELSWILATITNYGLMARSHAFKDKVEKGLSPNVGLFTYPILMAADILIYQTDLVPVGPDQIQHVEIAQDLAGSFNSIYSTDLLKKPEIKISPFGKIPGLDGEKMSKSHKNIIPLFLEGKPLQKIVSSIVTDGKDFKTEPLTVEDTVCKLYDLFATADEKKQLREDYLLNRSFGYGHAKILLKEKIETYFAPYTQKYHHLKSHPSEVKDVLEQGAEKARNQAKKTLNAVRHLVGL